MDEFIDNIIKDLPQEQADFLEAHRADFVDYMWDHENWPLAGFFHEYAEKYPDDDLTKKMKASLKKEK